VFPLELLQELPIANSKDFCEQLSIKEKLDNLTKKKQIFQIGNSDLSQ
jgi:hypothetical protein